MVQVIPSLVVAPLYFQSKIELGVVSQSYGAFNHILNDLSIIINQFESLSTFAAGIGRLGDFVDAMEISQQRQARLLQQEAALTNTTVQATTWEQTTWWDAFKDAISVSGIEPADPTPLRVVVDRAVKELLPITGGESAAELAQAEHARPSEPTPPRDVVVGGSCEVGEITSSEVSGTPLRVQGLRLFTPDCARELMTNLDLEMKPGQVRALAEGPGPCRTAPSPPLLHRVGCTRPALSSAASSRSRSSPCAAQASRSALPVDAAPAHRWRLRHGQVVVPARSGRALDRRRRAHHPPAAWRDVFPPSAPVLHPRHAARAAALPAAPRPLGDRRAAS
jgi:hypothetical protein